MRVISLGWGVQSFTLAAMAALGAIEPVDYAIHADTGWERAATYEFVLRWQSWLEEHGVPVVTVRAPEKDRNPVKNLRSGGGEITIPAYTENGAGIGTLRRQCTNLWKLAPMHRYIRFSGATRKDPAVQLIGISKDEWHRAKDSDVLYVQNSFPLLDMEMTRADCAAWLQEHGLEVPGKSSCTFCPFHNARAWQEMKREGGADWQQAVEIDAAIRDKRPPYPLYLHRKCVPLADAVAISEDYGLSQMGFVDIDDAACDSGACFL